MTNLSNRNISILRVLGIFFLIVLVAIQFIRPARNSGLATGPADITHFVNVPDTVRHILMTSCYDCHSNHTVYPWYANINPVGLWLHNHVEDGKEAINFSDLSHLSKKKLDHRLKDIAEQVETGEMPLTSYTLIHRYALLDSVQVGLIKNWTVTARREVNFQ